MSCNLEEALKRLQAIVEKAPELAEILAPSIAAVMAAKDGKVVGEEYSHLPDRKSKTQYTNHTGGAYGADSILAEMLRPYGVVNVHYRPAEDKPTKRVKELSAKDKVVNIHKEEQEAGRNLNKKLGNGTHDLNNRNFVQVLNADTVFAVAPLKGGKVQGGTGSAVRMAEYLGKEVYVLDTETVQWFKSENGKYIKIDYIPTIPLNFAAVGTRGIEKYPTMDKKTGKFVDTELHRNTAKILGKLQEFVKQLEGKQPLKEGSINIYSTDKNGFEGLSNLAVRPFTFKGKVFQSVEHAYQSLKSGTGLENSVYEKDWSKGGLVKRGTKGTKTENDWNIKLMRMLMEASFNQNPEAQKLLRSTGNAALTHNVNDKVWRDVFPKILEDIRSKLQDISTSDKEVKSTGNVEVSKETFTVDLLKQNPKKLYVFGDNLRRKGKAGQAVIRGEKNALGIASKKAPSNESGSFFNDSEIEDNMVTIDADIHTIKDKTKNYDSVVFPFAGIGTGLAQLQKKAPKTFNYLSEQLYNNFGFVNPGWDGPDIDSTDIKIDINKADSNTRLDRIQNMTQKDVNPNDVNMMICKE